MKNSLKLVLSAEQQQILSALQAFNSKLTHSKYFKLFDRKNPYCGVYLHGKVGRGKTMLMDMFYAQLPVEVSKLRTHYQNFMLDVHQRLFKLDQEKYSRDMLRRVAKDFATKYRLICLDELQISDIADAMIVGRLFENLFKLGVIMVITSNSAVEELYKNGLQREYFLKFIDLIKVKLKIIEVIAPVDYRLEKAVSVSKRYFYPLDQQVKNEINDLIRHVAGDHLETIELQVQGRILRLNQVYKNILVSSFAELCSKAMGSADYQKICEQFKVIFLLDIPQLSHYERNEAKRLMMLIDQIYANKLMFICSAAVPANSLYLAGEGSIEFQRTISRLIEMQSSEYI